MHICFDTTSCYRDRYPTATLAHSTRPYQTPPTVGHEKRQKALAFTRVWVYPPRPECNSESRLSALKHDCHPTRGR